jgi:hypothetical protein
MLFMTLTARHKHKLNKKNNFLTLLIQDTSSVSKSSPVRFFDLFLDRPDLRPVA